MLDWTQDVVVSVPQAPQKAKPKSKHSMLPVLIVLFLISYGLMALLAVEQDRTIASQRSLIRSLFGDSVELSSLKGKSLHKRAQEQALEKGRSKDPGSSTQSPQAPSTQETPGAVGQGRNSAKLRKEMPKKPPLGVADLVDGRRILKII